MFDLVANEPEGRAGLDALQVDESLFDNAVAQPLICRSQILVWSLLAPRLAVHGIAPSLFAGYSVGELAAHGCSGALCANATLALAGARAAAMDAASEPGDGLVALRGLSLTAVEALCARYGAHVAIVNGDDQIVVGGSRPAIDAMVDAVADRDASAQRLPVAVAAHTPRLAAAVEPFRRRLAAAPWRAASAPVLAGIDGSLVRDAATAVDVLARQLATAVRWSACMDSLRERGATVCLELGPGSALSRMLRERHREIEVRSVADFRSVDAVVDWVVRAS